MANRRDYFFRQKVTEAELDVGFNGLEIADFNLAIDHGLIGITDDMVVSEKSGTPDLTVDVSGPGTAYSKQGERIFFSSLQNVDLSIDDGAVSTAVATPGNARIVSLFVTFDRLLADPRIDGNSLTVFFERNESFAFSVVAGAEATSGSEVPPALDTNKILLADVTLIFSQTQIFNANIDVAAVSRREVAFAFAASAPVALSEGTPEAAVGALLTALNNHLSGTANKHPAADVTYPGAADWAGAISALAQAAIDVDGGLDGIVADLAAIVNPSGADKIGIRASVANWNDGSGFLASNVWGILNGILAVLGTQTGAGGSDLVGTPAVAGSPNAITAGAIADALAELLGHVNTHINDASAAHAGSAISNVADGNVVATDVQAAIDEVETHALQAWARFTTDGVGGSTLIDSHNVTSISTNGTSGITVTFTNTFANASYVAVATSGVLGFMPQIAAVATGTVRITIFDTQAGVDVDVDNVSTGQTHLMVIGDLS